MAIFDVPTTIRKLDDENVWLDCMLDTEKQVTKVIKVKRELIEEKLKDLSVGTSVMMTIDGPLNDTPNIVKIHTSQIVAAIVRASFVDESEFVKDPDEISFPNKSRNNIERLRGLGGMM
jgi:hypothetical protein